MYIMKKYNEFQRMVNIINRGVEEFGYEFDLTTPFEDVYSGACDCITENTDYDRIEECEMSNYHQHLSWSDGMGYDLEADGDFISGSSQAKDHTWARKDKGGFTEIDWTEATDDDYKFCHTVLDSKGSLVQLVCK